MNPRIELYAVQLPGRGSRITELPLSQIDVMLDGLMPEFTRHLDKPYALYGHSMGAMLGFELIRRLDRLRLPLPRAFFVCAANSPAFKSSNKAIYSLPEKEFLEEIRSLGATPEEFFSDPDLIALCLPTLRADFEAIERHEYGDISPVNVPLMVFGGQEDKDVSFESLAAWSRVTTGSFSIHLFPGGHFFVFSEKKAVIKLIHSILFDPH